MGPPSHGCPSLSRVPSQRKVFGAREHRASGAARGSFRGAVQSHRAMSDNTALDRHVEPRGVASAPGGDASSGTPGTAGKKKKMGKKERQKMRERAQPGYVAPEQPKKKEKPSRPDLGSGSGQPSPALLTANIKKAYSIEELFHTTVKHERLMNHIHLSAAWNSLGRLSRAAERSWFTTHADALEALVAHSIETISDFQKAAHVGARELANIAHGVAKSGGGGKKSGDLMRALARTIVRKLGSCNSQELANSTWAFAKADYLDEQLFTHLAAAVRAHLEANDFAFNAQELTNILWAFATASSYDAELFTGLARAVALRMDDFNSQGISNTAWALAKAGHVDAQALREMSRVAQGRLCEFNAQDLANTAWAFAKLGQFDAQLFTALAKAVDGHFMDNFNAQGLVNTAWAFAKAGHLDTKLFTTLGTAIRERLDDCNAQDLANTAWAFAKACHLDENLFTALARATEGQLEDSNIQDLVNTTWAFAKLGVFDAGLFTAVGACIKTQRLDDLDAPNMANLAWSFSKAGQFDKELFAGLARSAERLAGDFSAKDLANVAWTFANAGHLDDSLFATLAKVALQRFGDFDDDELDNLEWAFATARQNKTVERIKQRRKRSSDSSAEAGAGVDVDVSKCGRIVVAGGGIGGGAVAVALQKKGFDVVVLESDSSFDARKQGYGLTVQGQDAIQMMGINLAQDDAPSTSHYNFSAEGHILGFYGEAFGARSKDRCERENSGRFIHIPRQMLRHRILEKIRPGTIKWGSKLASYSCWCDGGGGGDGAVSLMPEKNGVTVTLTDGTTLDAALLIGSDGIFSVVRRQMNLPGDRLNYVGLCVVLGIVHKEVMKVPLAERRIFETMDGTTRIYAMPFTTTSTMWQLSFPCPEETSIKYMKDNAFLKEEIVRRCSNWHEPIPEMLRNTPMDCFSGYPVYDREVLEPGVLRAAKDTMDVGSQRRVTLIGDAAHPMTPFKAQGANQAMSDAVLLADTLVDSIRQHGPHLGFDAALPVFEQKMLSRSGRIVVSSREKAKELHSALALQLARKAQREAGFGVDMPKLLRHLREKDIGAHSATDRRGLDAVIEAEANKLSDSSGGDSSVGCDALMVNDAETVSATDNKRRMLLAEGEGKKKRRKGDGAPSSTGGNPEARELFWGQREGDWQKCVLLKTKKNGQHKVEWDDCSTSVLDNDDVKRRLWGYYDGAWKKCVLVKVTKKGKHRVEWKGGSTSDLDTDCVKPQLQKKSKR